LRKLSRVLVTGGAGFVGSHLVDQLLGEGFEVTVLDDFSTGRMRNISPHKKLEEFHLVRGDVRDIGVVEKVVEDVDAVLHEAALVDVALSIKKPLLFNDVNLVGTLNLLKACLNNKETC
jgi:nucleoside-diphosphate-sugar epimerase